MAIGRFRPSFLKTKPARTGGDRLKAQSALEMVAIFGGVMLILLIVVAAIPQEAAAAQALRAHSTATDSVNLVAQTASDVYLSGDGAVRTITIEVPDGVNMSASYLGATASETDWNKRKLADLRLLTGGDVFAVSRAPMCGEWPLPGGRYAVNLTYNGSGTAHVMVNSLSC